MSSLELGSGAMESKESVKTNNTSNLIETARNGVCAALLVFNVTGCDNFSFSKHPDAPETDSSSAVTTIWFQDKCPKLSTAPDCQ